MSSAARSTQMAMRITRHFAAFASLAVPVLAAESASADVIYHVYNAVIPNNIDGIYLNVETNLFASAASLVPGWDLNPYGTSTTAMSWFAAAAPSGCVTGLGGGTTVAVANLPLGSAVSSVQTFGNTASSVTAGGWVLNAVNAFGFRFLGADGLTHYGWGRIQIGATMGVRTLVDIGYESIPATPIAIGSEGGPPPDYNPCAATNPSVSVGSNNLPLNQTTAVNLDLTASSCSFLVRKANYFKFTAPVDGSYTFNTCASGVDTRIAILDGCAAGSAILACNDDTCGFSSSVTISLNAAVPVYLVVGSGTKVDLPSPISVAVIPPPIPDCVNAAPAAFGANVFDNFATVTPQSVVTNLAGTTSATINKAMWFKFTPGTTGAYSISLCGVNGDSMLAIGSVCPGVGGTFQSIAYNDDVCLVAGSTTSFLASFIDATNGGATGTFGGFPLTQDLVAGTDYYIVAGSYGATTSLTGTLTIGGPDQPTGNPADLNGDGFVTAQDLAILLGNWGGTGIGDINLDGTVSAPDLGALLNAWGS
jgi:hypothetical protein